MIKEYQIRQNELKRPVIVVKECHDTEVVREMQRSYNEPSLIADFLNDVFEVSHLADEHVWMLCLNESTRITGVFEISHGAVNHSLICIREMMRDALLSGATSIIVAHCHPTGNPEPSNEDIISTKRLCDACKMLDIKMLDHIIVGCEEPLTYYSFAEKNIMTNW